MKFRAGCFSVLALLALGWMIYGFMATSEAASQVANGPLPTSQYLSQSETKAYQDAGIAIGSGLGLTFFACTGLPLFALFALLSWRNNVGLATERRHQQQLAAMQYTAAAQVAQAQMQFAQMQQQQPGPATPLPLSGPSVMSPMFMSDEVKRHMQHARELIQKKDYKAARRLLERIDHPKAYEWLAKLPK